MVFTKNGFVYTAIVLIIKIVPRRCRGDIPNPLADLPQLPHIITLHKGTRCSCLYQRLNDILASARQKVVVLSTLQA